MRVSEYKPLLDYRCGDGDAQRPAASVDVTAILETLNEKNPQMLDWRKSIVDLIKLLARDGSLTTRKKFASKVHYTGADDSASMNIWLHKEIMTKIAANDGKVPADLTR